jgi:hypothetical protein
VLSARSAVPWKNASKLRTQFANRSRKIESLDVRGYCIDVLCFLALLMLLNLIFATRVVI